MHAALFRFWFYRFLVLGILLYFHAECIKCSSWIPSNGALNHRQRRTSRSIMWQNTTFSRSSSRILWCMNLGPVYNPSSFLLSECVILFCYEEPREWIFISFAWLMILVGLIFELRCTRSLSDVLALFLFVLVVQSFAPSLEVSLHFDLVVVFFFSGTDRIVCEPGHLAHLHKAFFGLKAFHWAIDFNTLGSEHWTCRMPLGVKGLER